ncbi:MAG: excinuclease ABC subunit A, partial [Armatimonadota bacterium]
MKADEIRIRGASQHNLDGLDIDLPKNSLIVFTGVSGSGKSSLAFDTIFVEGQRRYVESLSTYARQFLAKMGRPDVKRIEGLAPAIAIDQGNRSNNPRSTVATLTEISDFLRVLYAAIGVPHCPDCGEPIGSQTRESIVGRIMGLPSGSRVLIMAPVVQSRKGEFKDLLEDMSRRGYVRARVDGEVVRIDEVSDLDRYRRHTVEIVVDRVQIKDGVKPRVGEAVEDALELSEGTVVVAVEDGEDFLLSSSFACDACGRSLQEPTHATFSFNSPRGMCETCNGLGEQRQLVPELVVADDSKSLQDGAVPLLRSLNNTRRRHWFQGVADHYDFSLDTPMSELTDEQFEGLFHGSGDEDVEFYFRHPRRGWEWRHADPW